MKIILPSLLLFFYSCQSTPVKENPAELEIKRNLEEARKIEEKLAKENPADDKKIELIFEKSKLLLNGKAFREALESLEKLLLIKNGSRLPHFYYYLGVAYFGEGNNPKAISFLLRSEKEDTEFETHSKRKMLARAYNAEGKHGQAVAILGKASQDKTFAKDLSFYEIVAGGFLRLNLCNRSLPIAEEGILKFPESSVLKTIQQECKEKIEQKKP